MTVLPKRRVFDVAPIDDGVYGITSGLATVLFRKGR